MRAQAAATWPEEKVARAGLCSPRRRTAATGMLATGMLATGMLMRCVWRTLCRRGAVEPCGPRLEISSPPRLWHDCMYSARGGGGTAGGIVACAWCSMRGRAGGRAREGRRAREGQRGGLA